MQNVVTFMGATIKSEATFYSASSVAKISHVDVRDIASVAVTALTKSAHAGKSCTLTDPRATPEDRPARQTR